MANLEKYYLSEKMTKYILDVGGHEGGWQQPNAKINPSIAATIGVKSAWMQRAGVSNYVAPMLPNDVPVKEVREMLGYE
mgnify:CR=1 FL=1